MVDEYLMDLSTLEANVKVMSYNELQQKGSSIREAIQK